MSVPTRSPLSVAAAFLGLFAGGAAAGAGLARLLAPGSWWAGALSVFAFPVAFALGLQSWFYLALLGAVPRVARLLFRGGAGPVRPLVKAPIPGASAFVPIASGIGGAVGLVVGWLSNTHSVWLVTLVYWVAGTLYGLLAWRLARAGLLMPPEST